VVDPGADPGVPMGYWTEQDLPFYYGLARTFPLADHWFCSCLGPTYPNRRFLISGTAHGLIDDLPWDVVDYPPAGTVFDLLTDHGISWVDYHQVRPVAVLVKRLLGVRVLTAVRRLAQVGRWIPPVLNRVIGNKSFTADVYPLGLARCVLHLRTAKRFFADADAGTLPAFCLVDPDFGQFSEENPQDIARGESFAAEVINRVMAGPGWPHTLLIWLYDEHGGYYDHVPPPAAVAPDDVPAHNYQLDLPAWLRGLLRPVLGRAFAGLANIDAGPADYTRYGFRVPAVIVSPYARPGYVCGRTLDHTAILKLIEQTCNLPPLTRRDAAAESFLDALDLDGEPAFAHPPELPAPSLPRGSWRRGPRRLASCAEIPLLVRHKGLSISARPATRGPAGQGGVRRSAAGQCRREWRRLRSCRRRPGWGRRRTGRRPARWSGCSVTRGRRRPACHRLGGCPRAAVAAGGCTCCGSRGRRRHRGG
jgi:phospholipase C